MGPGWVWIVCCCGRHSGREPSGLWQEVVPDVRNSMPKHKNELPLLHWSGAGIAEIGAPLGWAKSEISGNGAAMQPIYGSGVFWKLEDSLWTFKASFSHVTSGSRILEEQEGLWGLLLSTIYPLISWVRNNESQADEIMGPQTCGEWAEFKNRFKAFPTNLEHHSSSLDRKGNGSRPETRAPILFIRED